MSEYKLEHIYDLANIPDEALPRFIEELPKIVGHMRDVKALQSLLGDDAVKINPLTWVDDGEQDATITMTFTGEE